MKKCKRSSASTASNYQRIGPDGVWNGEGVLNDNGAPNGAGDAGNIPPCIVGPIARPRDQVDVEAPGGMAPVAPGTTPSAGAGVTPARGPAGIDPPIVVDGAGIPPLGTGTSTGTNAITTGDSGAVGVGVVGVVASLEP